MFITTTIHHGQCYTKRIFKDHHTEVYPISPEEYFNRMLIFGSPTLTYRDLCEATNEKQIRCKCCVTETEIWYPLDGSGDHWINLFGYDGYKEDKLLGIYGLYYRENNERHLFQFSKELSYSSRTQHRAIQKLIASMLIFSPHLLFDEDWLDQNPRIKKNGQPLKERYLNKAR